MQAPFPRMSYDDAVKKLQAKGSEIQWGSDFGSTDETLLTEDLDRPVMVDRYPAQVKAFYFQPDPDRPEVALGVDVHRPRRLRRNHRRRPAHPRSGPAAEKRLEEHKLPREAFDWYLDLRKYGTVPHAGFGMGVERFVAWMCGLEHIRETIASRACCTGRGRERTMQPATQSPSSARRSISAPDRRGVDMGPSALRVANLERAPRRARLRGRGPGQRPGRSAGERGRRPAAARAICRRSRRPARAWPTWWRRRSPAGKFPLVLGGDHSIAIGTVAGMSHHFSQAAARSIGLIWIDAHADMNTPETTPSGNVHGMPLACCIGLGPDGTDRPLRLRAQGRSRRNVVLVGLRDVDALERPQRAAVRRHAPSPCAISTSAACAP